jgi:serine/threonine-protein kinase
MTSERWSQIEKLYHAAVELDAELRSEFLDRACTGDEELRREIDSLLAFEPKAGNFIESPAFELAATMLASDQPNTLIGTTIGPYQVLLLIGAGGMGDVYLAEDARLGRKIALKLLPNRFTGEPDRLRRFELEARAASALNHPNILTIFEIGRADEVHYIATEYIKGETLRQRMKTSRLELRTALDIGSQIASALASAHEAGIVHRDIKPENVMLRPDGYVKVLDFGIAKLTEKYRRILNTSAPTIDVSTQTGVVIGTTRYMSPEQARGQKIDARSDLFSLGVVLYEMISNSPPFSGATSADILAAILAHEPPLESVPGDLRTLVARALRKDRDERYQTADEMLADLRSSMQRLVFEHELKRTMQASALAPASSAQLAAGPGPARRLKGEQKIIDSLAVLPLVNTVGDSSVDYLSDGITENIIDSLSQLPELRVMAWNTVSRYKNREVDPRLIGEDLGVSAVLVGKLVERGNRVVIKTELVDAGDGSHLWSESYDCEHASIFAVESRISKEISEKLLLRLTTEERRRLSKRYTENTEAYHAYLKGRYFWNKRTDEDVRQGIECFKQAIECDPSYALAYVGLADSYIILGSFGVATMPPHEAIPRAREAAARALEIDGTLAEAHASLAYCLAIYYWDWPGAEKEFNQSFEFRPAYATARHWYGFAYLVARGQIDEAIREEKRALDLDPLSLTISANVGLLLYLARQYDEAITQYRKTLEMDRNFAYAHWQLGLAYEQKHMHAEAISEFKAAVALFGKSTLPIELLGHAYAISGQRQEALRILDELSALSEQHHVSPYRIAAIHAGLGDKKQAFEQLGRAFDQRDPWLIWLAHDPVLDPLRRDRRFASLVRRIGDGESPQPTKSRRPTSTRRPARRAISSLAILPLANVSDNADMEYLGEGLTESIINTLSGLPKLRVVARSTVFRYKGGGVDPQQVARELNVQAVLTGRVHQTADRLTIAVELIDIAADAQIWGERYSRAPSDLLQVQQEIASEITEKLRLRLSRKEKVRIAKRHTQDADAYQSYLKGRYFWNKRSVESLRKGIEYFTQAIDRDPGFASAYAGLSDSYTLLVVREALPPDEGFSKARAAAVRALEIDEALAEAHASLGHALLHNWQWQEGEAELRRAIELNAGYASAHHWYSEHLTAMGRCDESIRELKLAAGLDPLSLVISADLGRAFYFAREYDLAIQQEGKTLEMDSGFWLSHINLGRSHTQKGMHAEAIVDLEKACELSSASTEAVALLSFAFAAAGKRDGALKMLEALYQQAERGPVPPYHYAIAHTGLGDTDRAFEWLERAFQKHAVDLFTLKVDPMLDGLRSDPRFETLLRRVGLNPSQTSSTENVTQARRPVLRAGAATIAVLPLNPINPEHRDEYLELGLADALITRLSDIDQVVVRPTSSVRKYCGLEQDSVTAGKELAVESVLEGSIQKLGDRIRITSRLLRVSDGCSLWAGKFDEPFTDIFAVEDSISERVAAALALKLTGNQKERLTKRYTDNTQAYHLYLQGRYHWNKRSEETLLKAIECFNQALELDPNFALAYAGLADCYTKLGDVGVTAIIPREAFARARDAAVLALQIDDGLAEVHASLGHLDMHLLRWSDAERDFNRAIELNPNYASAHQWYGYFMAFHYRFDEALNEIETARSLDPLSLAIADSVGEFLYFARRNDEAIAQFRKVLELDPDFLPSRINLGRAYEQAGMFDEAEAQFVRARRVTAESVDALAALGHTYARSANTRAALEVLSRLSDLSKERYVSPYGIALIHAALGQPDEAFRFLEQAHDACVEWMIYTNVDPRLDPLRADARFGALLGLLGFAQTKQRR